MKTLYTLGFALLVAGAATAQTTTSIGQIDGQNSIIKTAGNNVIITAQTANVSIYDVTGKLVDVQTLTGTSAINMANYDLNTYFIKVEANGESFVKKGVVVK